MVRIIKREIDSEKDFLSIFLVLNHMLLHLKIARSVIANKKSFGNWYRKQKLQQTQRNQIRIEPVAKKKSSFLQLLLLPSPPPPPPLSFSLPLSSSARHRVKTKNRKEFATKSEIVFVNRI